MEDVCYEDLLLLLSHSSAEDINQSHKGGRAPMHVVCARGHLVALQLLLWVSCVCVCVCACVRACVCVHLCVCVRVCSLDTSVHLVTRLVRRPELNLHSSPATPPAPPPPPPPSVLC